MNNMKEALEIKKALLLLADFTGMTPQELVSSICFLDKKMFNLFKDASDKWNSFEDEKDIVKRGAMIGIKITNRQGGGII